MSGEAGRLRAEALRLAAVERAELAYCLLRSLDAEADAETAAIWDVAFERRWPAPAADEDADPAAASISGRCARGW